MPRTGRNLAQAEYKQIDNYKGLFDPAKRIDNAKRELAQVERYLLLLRQDADKFAAEMAATDDDWMRKCCKIRHEAAIGMVGEWKSRRIALIRQIKALGGESC